MSKQSIRSEISEMRLKAAALDAIADLLWPTSEPEREWGSDTIEEVASVVLSVYPKAPEGDRTQA